MRTKFPILPDLSFSSFLPGQTDALTRDNLTTLQINLGKLCNQACLHCHVDAGPKRTEQMTSDTMVRVIELLDGCPSIETVDITGGAPEMNPHFRELVRTARRLNKEVIDRCNLTILMEDGQEDLAEFLAAQGVRVVASLPCYTSDNVDKQRGKGTFGASIDGLRRLNALGYGHQALAWARFGLQPRRCVLPPAQRGAEADYRERLRILTSSLVSF